MSFKAWIFDLDGVIVSTDEYHYRAWKKIADEECVCFDRHINQQLRGISRTESLEIILRNSTEKYSEKKKHSIAEKKNSYYRDLIQILDSSSILPGVEMLLRELRQNAIKIAVASSSKNCNKILQKIGMADFFDAVVDGCETTMSKPDPEVFLLASEKLSVPPSECLVIEDAEAGVTAALKAGMKVLGVGFASKDKRATYRAEDLTQINTKIIDG